MPPSVRILSVLAIGLSACAGSRPTNQTVAAGTITNAVVPPFCGVIAGAGLLEIELTEAPTDYPHETMLVVVRCMGDSEAAKGTEPIVGRQVRFNVAPLDAMPAEKRYGMFQVVGEVPPDLPSDLPLYGLLNRVGAEDFEPEWVGS